jgi:hypothetical protein
MHAPPEKNSSSDAEIFQLIDRSDRVDDQRTQDAVHKKYENVNKKQSAQI